MFGTRLPSVGIFRRRQLPQKEEFFVPKIKIGDGFLSRLKKIRILGIDKKLSPDKEIEEKTKKNKKIKLFRLFPGGGDNGVKIFSMISDLKTFRSIKK